MKLATYVARACLALVVVWALLMPSLALADDDDKSDSSNGRSCSSALASRNPQCAAPEVPLSVLYPVLGGLSFAAVTFVRPRRRSDIE